MRSRLARFVLLQPTLSHIENNSPVRFAAGKSGACACVERHCSERNNMQHTLVRLIVNKVPHNYSKRGIYVYPIFLNCHFSHSPPPQFFALWLQQGDYFEKRSKSPFSVQLRISRIPNHKHGRSSFQRPCLFSPQHYHVLRHVSRNGKKYPISSIK